MAIEIRSRGLEWLDIICLAAQILVACRANGPLFYSLDKLPSIVVGWMSPRPGVGLGRRDREQWAAEWQGFGWIY